MDWTLKSWTLILYISWTLFLASVAGAYNGRHVCAHTQHISQPVPERHSYIRAVYKKDAQRCANSTEPCDSVRVTYQTAYRTIFRMKIRAQLVPGCCPGWEKRSPRDKSCMKPVCSQPCVNDGQCVAPNICMCPEGYTGRWCELDINECEGRNQCQQKCINLQGSYECSCMEGFRLANDESSCELCLECTEQFQNIQARLEQVQSQPQIPESMTSRLDKQDDILENLETTQGSIEEIFHELKGLPELRKQIEELSGRVDDQKDELQSVRDMTLDYVPKIEEEITEMKQIQQQTDVSIVSVIEQQMEAEKKLEDVTEKLSKDMPETKRVMKRQAEMTTEIAVVQEKLGQINVKHVEDLAANQESLEAEVRTQAGIQENLKDLVAEVMKDMDNLKTRIIKLENEKEILQKNLSETVTQYEAVIAAFAQKEDEPHELMTSPTTTYDPYAPEEMDHMPLDRLASLSQQISILEEKMADCNCGGMNYYG